MIEKRLQKISISRLAGFGRNGLFGIILLILLVHAVTLAPPVSAETSPVSQEYKVKAAFLYNFSMFVEWPADVVKADTVSPFVICVIGKNPFGDFLDGFQGRRTKNRPIRIHYADHVKDIGNCQMLFVSSSEQIRLKEIMDMVKDRRGVLTVSDIPGFLQAGGAINLVHVADKMKFDINIKVTKQYGFSINHQLLNMAHDIVN